jgi:hypothetical protein
MVNRYGGNGGPLNPEWVEWLMGWPLGWTNCSAQMSLFRSASEPSETAKFLSWLHVHFRAYIAVLRENEP